MHALFVTYGGGHVNAVLPVIQALREQPGTRVTTIGLTTAGPVLTRAGVPFIGFRDLPGARDERVQAVGRSLVPAASGGVVPHDESVAYHGLCYTDLVDRLGEAAAAARYAELGRQCFAPVGVMERAIEWLQPDLVVATNSPRAERAAIEAAGARGIPSICLVDLFARQEIRWIGTPGFATRLCVLDEYVRVDFLRAGRREDEVVVTGNPAFAGLARPGLAEEGSALRDRRGWKPHEQVVLWASQPEPEVHPFTGQPGDPALTSAVDGALFDAVERRPGTRLVVRRHPSEGVGAPCPGWVDRSPGDEPLAPLLAAVDAVVTMSSTVGFEAALLGKPLVSVRLSIFSPDAPYAEMGIARGVDDLSDMPAALDEVLDGTWRPSRTLVSPGAATANVLRVIAELS